MDIKTGSNIDLQKRSSLVNGIMQKFGSVVDAQNGLTKDGMFGYVFNEGIYLNLNGTVNKIAPSNTTTPSANAFYQSTQPSPTGLGVGALWYNTTNNSLNIWTNTSWLQIGGNSQASILTVWASNETYLANQMVLHLGNLWYNNTGNTIATTTFINNDWTNLTEKKLSIFDLLRTQGLGSTLGDVSLSADGLVFTITHNCGLQYPIVEVVNLSTNKKVMTDIEYTSTSVLKITNIDTLTNLGLDLRVRIQC